MSIRSRAAIAESRAGTAIAAAAVTTASLSRNCHERPSKLPCAIWMVALPKTTEPRHAFACRGSFVRHLSSEGRAGRRGANPSSSGPRCTAPTKQCLSWSLHNVAASRRAVLQSCASLLRAVAAQVTRRHKEKQPILRAVPRKFASHCLSIVNRHNSVHWASTSGFTHR